VRVRRPTPAAQTPQPVCVGGCPWQVGVCTWGWLHRRDRQQSYNLQGPRSQQHPPSANIQTNKPTNNSLCHLSASQPTARYRIIRVEVASNPEFGKVYPRREDPRKPPLCLRGLVQHCARTHTQCGHTHTSWWLYVARGSRASEGYAMLPPALHKWLDSPTSHCFTPRYTTIHIHTYIQSIIHTYIHTHPHTSTHM
jgi:hypothetical protein